MFVCLRRCSCVEPSDPTNGTLKFWEVNNITASEIYWEALEVKVQEAHVTRFIESKHSLSVVEVHKTHTNATSRFSTFKCPALPDGGS